MECVAKNQNQVHIALCDRVTTAWSSARRVVTRALCCAYGVEGARRGLRMPLATSSVPSVTRMVCRCAQNAAS